MPAKTEPSRYDVGAYSLPQLLMEQLPMKSSFELIPALANARKRSPFDFRGFLMGIAVSATIGAVLYIFLSAR